MRHPLLSILLAAIPAVAAAQPGLSVPPAPPPPPAAPPAPPAPPAPADYTAGDDIPCVVNIVRAPDDVRQVIEAWVAAEPSCSTTLTLRVVPTDGGYFLFAQRSDGRIHERLVPDAQTAGVLVTSWIAADSGGGDGFYAPPTPPEPAIAPIPPVPPTPDMPTPEVEVIEEESRVVVLDGRDSRTERWMTAVALANIDGPSGVRVERDLVAQGSFGLLTAVQYSQSKQFTGTASSYGDLWADDFKAVVAATATYDTPTYAIRASLGGGILYTRGRYDEMGPVVVHGGSNLWSPTAEGSLMLSRKFGEDGRWAIALGVVATAISQTHAIDLEPHDYYDIEELSDGIRREGMLVEAMVGLRKRL